MCLCVYRIGSWYPDGLSASLGLIKLFLSNNSEMKAIKHGDNVAVAVSHSVKSLLRFLRLTDSYSYNILKCLCDTLQLYVDADLPNVQHRTTSCAETERGVHYVILLKITSV